MWQVDNEILKFYLINTNKVSSNPIPSHVALGGSVPRHTVEGNTFCIHIRLIEILRSQEFLRIF